MDGWKYYEGKKIFVILRNKRQYQGIVLEVEQDRNGVLFFITIRDKFNKRISFVSSEIELIQEEE